MFLPHQDIKRLAMEEKLLLDPFSEPARHGGVSHGCGPASYDLRVDRDLTFWPGHSRRADAIERIKMPKYLLGLIFSKSTWARVHIEHAGTVVDPGFEGVLRLEINMHYGDNVIDIPAGTGIAQILFAPLCNLQMLIQLGLIQDTVYPYGGFYLRQGPNQDAIFR